MLDEQESCGSIEVEGPWCLRPKTFESKVWDAGLTVGRMEQIVDYLPDDVMLLADRRRTTSRSLVSRTSVEVALPVAIV